MLAAFISSDSDRREDPSHASGGVVDPTDAEQRAPAGAEGCRGGQGEVLQSGHSVHAVAPNDAAG